MSLYLTVVATMSTTVTLLVDLVVVVNVHMNLYDDYGHDDYNDHSPRGPRRDVYDYDEQDDRLPRRSPNIRA